MNMQFKQLLVLMISVAVASYCIAVEKEKTSWKFCVTGDSRGSNKGINSKVLKRLVTELKKEKPEYVIFVGDLVSGYTGVKKLTQQLTYWRDTFMAPVRVWDEKYADPAVKKIIDFCGFGYMTVEISGNQATLTMKAWNKENEQLKVIDTFKYNLE